MATHACVFSLAKSSSNLKIFGQFLLFARKVEAGSRNLLFAAVDLGGVVNIRSRRMNVIVVLICIVACTNVGIVIWTKLLAAYKLDGRGASVIVPPVF